ncbi:MAG: site-specific DNA-methyltransferase [Candidatus Nanoarchaeia archaeon]|nr:site-specific DNA-methyltransferase [Candidatus Nanoarchaeia archaeon]
MLELNKIYLGDCLEIMKKVDNNSIDLILTDIPYDEVNNNNSCINRSKYQGQLRKYNKGIADELTFDLDVFMQECDRICNGTIYIFCGLRQASKLMEYFKTKREKDYMARLCIWKKTNPTPSNGQHMWLSGTELCVFAKRRKAKFKQYCKSNVWESPSGKSKTHPTEKPLALFQFLIESSSDENDLVLDPCSGSGTTGLACMNTKRNYILIEKNEKYFNLAKERIEKHKILLSEKLF